MKKNNQQNLLSKLRDKKLEIFIIFVLILVSSVLYLQLGRVDMITAPADNKEVLTIEGDNHSGSAADIASLLGPLAAKLKQNPDDANGWALLARSYVEIGQHASAFESFEKAIQLIPDDPQLLADYADAMALVHGHEFKGKPDALIQKALAINPDHEKALLLAATSAFNQGNYQEAINHWTHLQEILPMGSPIVAEVSASIAEAHQLAGNGNITLPIKKVNQNKRFVAEISGVVRVSADLSSQVSPEDTLFIFAKAVNGPPMPIAAVKAAGVRLPYVYHLNDSNVLNPEQKLSSVKEVVVIARLSKDGDAIPKAGDLQGSSQVIRVGEVLQDIEINQKIQ
jgi:cytochrome c-type biogenesis protein CcmH